MSDIKTPLIYKKGEKNGNEHRDGDNRNKKM